MSITKAFLLQLSILCITSGTLYSQDLKGQWVWKGGKYEGTAKIDSALFHNTIYFPNSDNKVLETYQYYLLEKNKLYLSDEPFTPTTDKKTKIVYKVKFGESADQLTILGKYGEEIYNKKTENTEVSRIRPNELYFIDNKLQCYDTERKPSKAGNCLNIAGINFYTKYNELIELLGKPFRSTINPDNSQTFLFLAYPKDKKSPLFGVTFKENEIIKLELTGYKTNDDFSFSSIRLGDYYTFVKNKLGEPHYKKEVKAAGDETWVYMPIPLTIEFRLNKVSSISIEPFQLERQ